MGGNSILSTKCIVRIENKHYWKKKKINNNRNRTRKTRSCRQMCCKLPAGVA